MAFLSFITGERRSLENPKRSIADPSNWFTTTSLSGSDVDVSEASALGVPAIWQAVNLISGTIANLPLHLYKVVNGEASKATADPLYRVIHDRANDIHTKSVFFKWLIWRALVSPRGRGLALILRNAGGRVAGFLPLDEGSTIIEQSVVNGRVVRTYATGTKVYSAADVIDIAPIMASNAVDALSPITMNRDAIAAIIEAERYATALFANGGVPPLTLTGPLASPASADRASEQIETSLKIGKNRKQNVLPIPTGFQLENLGFDPSKQQMIELRRFQISEVSRIYNVAPALLHDLTTGTYSNVEQQTLSFAIQTILPLVKLIEQELNLKLFGAKNNSNYVEFNVDGLVRGDLKSRMDALARAVNAALITPNEARALDNRPAMEGGDKLYVQGATVPLADAGKAPATPTTTDQAPVEDEPLNTDEDTNGEA